ncbi:uncharacterized protein FIBRA_02351 [Fibroporia radiculosa]|uniref:Uncharacterized protein n=1 Tax=Fibroporia radiculosa TaxID=599839 RepID=J4I905_9APHY|nr:uncharacterized protein FIBRA_02351 [Fibroporia radiculosa]CCM00321.1 predicted protein [Fibroporia radiculosa]
MASAQIQTFLKNPEEQISRERSLEFLDAKFTTIQDLEGLSHLEEIVQQAKDESNEIGVQLSFLNLDKP